MMMFSVFYIQTFFCSLINKNKQITESFRFLMNTLLLLLSLIIKLIQAHDIGLQVLYHIHPWLNRSTFDRYKLLTFSFRSYGRCLFSVSIFNIIIFPFVAVLFFCHLYLYNIFFYFAIHWQSIINVQMSRYCLRYDFFGNVLFYSIWVCALVK